MKIKQLIKLCGEMCHVDLSAVDFSAQTEPTDETALRLLECCNLVLDELYRRYALLICKTVVTAQDGFVSLADLPVGKIVSLRDAFGNDVRFCFAEGGLSVQADGKLNLVYSKLPKQVGWNDQLSLPSPEVSERIAVYGVIAEFLHSAGDESAMSWQEKYEDAFRAATVKTNCGNMPCRRWL